MSVNQKFSFLSPGIKLNEVDLSLRGEPVVGDGALIIGQSKMGPAMNPVVVRNLSDFEAVFGKAQSGQSPSTEGWRSGNQALPTYGVYAAQAWLASQTSPVTFVRLMGDSDVSSGTKAGWSMGTPAVSVTPNANKSAFGLWICQSGSTGQLNGTLAAIMYSQGGVFTLNGTVAGTTSTTTSSVGTFIVSDSNAGIGNAFTIEFFTAAGVKETFPISMDPSSDTFIRNVMNTNPHHLISGQKSEDKSYFLGETFETELQDLLADNSSTGAGKQFGVIMPLAKNATIAENWSNRNMVSKKSKTGWIIANDPSPTQSTSSFAASNMKKLFRIVSLHDGEEFEKKYGCKIYIDSLSTNSSEYSEFTIEVFDIETGAELESFGGLNLNPNSTNFVAAAIGNSVASYNTTLEQWQETGEYPNKSDYIYIEMDEAYQQAHKSAVPFGFYGPAKPKAFEIAGAADGSGSLNSNVTYAYAFNATGSAIYAGHETDGFSKFQVVATASFTWPELKTTSSGSVNNKHYTKNAFFGVRHVSKSKEFAARPYIYGNKLTQDYTDLVRALPADLDAHSTSSETEFSFIFTLDDLVQDVDNPIKYYYEEGSHANGDAYTAKSGSTGTNGLVSSEKINKLIVPFFGGFEGVDIRRVDPFSSQKVLNVTSDNETNHYAHKAIKKVLDFTSQKVEDGGLTDYDLISMPGLTNTSLVRELIDNTAVRSDALAIIDVDSGFIPKEVQNNNARGSVNTIVTNIKDEDYNTSYAACYYPEVKLRDGAIVPSSIAGIGAIASSERQSGAPWFAPAGFNRGGISVLGGPGGPAVKDLNVKLNKADRDELYSFNINPIASFPSEGPVVFGQKTLQQTPSALDRINVRRLMIYLKKNVGKVSRELLFEPNVQATWNRFIAAATPILDDAKARFGIVDYKLVLDETTTTDALVDQNVLYAQVFVKPAYAIEFIVIDFAVTRSGIEF